jgi:hypothetical protein
LTCDGFVDRLREAPNKKTRERIVKDNNYCKKETSAPFLAPRWTRVGYEVHLKDAVTESLDNYEYDADIGEQMDEEEGDEENDDEKGVNEKEEEGVK